MSEEKFDVVIIGGGNAGIGVTGPVRRAGLSVAMIEAHDLGGTCPNRGCTPKKVLVAAGQALHDIELAAQHRIAVSIPSLDWSALIAREKDIIKDIPANLARAMTRRKVEVIKGHGTFAGPNSVRIGNRTLRASHIVIAAGSKPRPLPIPGAEHMMTSDDMLSERKRPESIIFIGGGVISLEFGHVYARAGSSVTILEALPQLLPARRCGRAASGRERAHRAADQHRCQDRANRGKRRTVPRYLYARGHRKSGRSRLGRQWSGAHRRCREPWARRWPGRSRQRPHRYRQLSALNLQFARLYLWRCRSGLAPTFAYRDV